MTWRDICYQSPEIPHRMHSTMRWMQPCRAKQRLLERFFPPPNFDLDLSPAWARQRRRTARDSVLPV
eukprot:336398-Rhodomonas_salina.2